MVTGGQRQEIGNGQYEAIAGFVLAGEPRIPETTLRMAAHLLADTLAVTAGSSLLEVSRIVRNHALCHMGAGGGAPTARILFDGRKTGLIGAAFAAASQTDNLDAHDGYYPTKGHIGCAVVPALFALAETLPTLSGPQALQAMVIGYEVAARAGIALHETASDYHTSGAWNALGVAAMACRLLGHDETVLRHALGIAEYHGPRSQMMREIDHPTMLHDGSGMGALIGLQAALLAGDGFEGAPAITAEASSIAGIWEDLGTLWTTDANYMKPYPICRWAHAAIDAMRALRMQHGISPDDVASVRINTFHEASRLFDGMPATTSQAQYSLKFAVATMLRHGRIGPEHIRGKALADAETADIVSRIEVYEAGIHNSRFPAGRWSDVTLVLTDGRILHSGDTPARGGIEAPMDDAEFKEKFHAMTGPVMDGARAAAILEKALGMTAHDASFRDLADLCY